MPIRKLSANFIAAEQKVAARKAELQANPLLTVPQAAQWLGVSVSTLNRWRSLGRGPASEKLGGKVFYPLSDLQAFCSKA
ncbi:helix-turn-helix transcriptional regulator [Mesorhizobium sp. 2RAF45]|uniref:helix-turn-helix transcriptional regulator n=1 Tax=Mesorhizobium sp. 2RAF45 TaxID=3233001 RepID=UPI003F9B7C0A